MSKQGGDINIFARTFIKICTSCFQTLRKSYKTSKELPDFFSKYL